MWTTQLFYFAGITFLEISIDVGSAKGVGVYGAGRNIDWRGESKYTKYILTYTYVVYRFLHLKISQNIQIFSSIFTTKKISDFLCFFLDKNIQKKSRFFVYQK